MNGSAPQEDVINLREYFGVVTRFKWRIAFLSIAVTMLASLFVFSLPPVYQATATLMVESEPAKALSIDEVYGLDSSRKEFLLTQFQIIKSKSIAEEVVRRLDLRNSPEFDPDQREPSLKDRIKSWLRSFSPPEDISLQRREELKFQRITREFQQRLNVTPVPDTQLVDISFESASPELAAEAANMVAAVYIESQVDAKIEVTQGAASWLNTRLDDLRVKLESSEKALQEFQEQEGLVDVKGVLGLGAQELNELTAQLLLARKELKEASSLRSLVRARGANIEALATLPEVLNHSVIQDVKRAEVEASSKLSELAQRYGPMHPKLIAARDQLAVVQAKLRTEVRQLVAGIESDYETAVANERALVEELAEKKDEYQQVTRKEALYAELSREVEVNTQLYNTFLMRFKETDQIAGFQAPAARLVDQADAPQAPAKPRKKLILLFVFVVTALVSVALTFILEAMNDSIRTPEDVEYKLGQPMVGLLPRVSHDKKKGLGLRIFFDANHYKFSEAVRTLRTSLVLSRLEDTGRVIAITSSLPGEGKSTVSENLAFALAQMEKVLLIDTDMRQPSLGARFGLPENHPGLSNLILGTASLTNCIHQDEKTALDVIPAGAIPRNPQELLATSRFEGLLKKLSEKYDRIILDTAPAQVVSDALVLSRLSDSMLYVVKADSTRQKIVSNGIARLLQVGANLGGVVLNQVDTSSRSSNYGEYYGYYGGRYGYGQTIYPAEGSYAAAEAVDLRQVPDKSVGFS